MLIATDPLSLVFIACFLFGLLFLLATSLLGNLGQGHAGIHAGSSHTGLHLGGHAPATHTVSHVRAPHAPAHGIHVASHHPAHTHSVGHCAGAHRTSNPRAQGSWLSPM